MTGAELIEAAAKRATAQWCRCSECIAVTEREFAPFAELYEAAKHSHEMNQVTPALCAALADVEKLGRETR